MINVLVELSDWMEENGFLDQQNAKLLDQLIRTNHERNREITFIGESSRGKSQLINSSLLYHGGIDILPSSPGRTTRCTVEIGWNPSLPTQLSLLPTLTSKSVQSAALEELRDDDSYWTILPFAKTNPAAARELMLQVTESEWVTLELAEELGFDVSVNSAASINREGKVEIPKWRHARLNYPQPDLPRGVNIIDTPGFNTLGIEPEITMRALKERKLMVLVVNFDSGLTLSDIEIWRDHLIMDDRKDAIVVLNKVDMIWDQTHPYREIEKQINAQIAEVANQLNIKPCQVIAVSAKKAAIARQTNDAGLLRQSNIEALEHKLLGRIERANARVLNERVSKELMPIINHSERIILQRIRNNKTHLNALKSHAGKSPEKNEILLQGIADNTSKLQKIRRRVERLVLEIENGFQICYEKLDVHGVEKMIAHHKLVIGKQLTTPGLKTSMKHFQNSSFERFMEGLDLIKHLDMRIENLYAYATDMLEIKGIAHRSFKTMHYIESMNKLKLQHDEYTSNINLLLTQKQTLRNRYHAAIMMQIRDLFKMVIDDMTLWRRNSLIPLQLEITEVEKQLEMRKNNIERIQSHDSDIEIDKKLLADRVKLYSRQLMKVAQFKLSLQKMSLQSNASENALAGGRSTASQTLDTNIVELARRRNET